MDIGRLGVIWRGEKCFSSFFFLRFTVYAPLFLASFSLFWETVIKGGRDGLGWDGARGVSCHLGLWHILSLAWPWVVAVPFLILILLLSLGIDG